VTANLMAKINPNDVNILFYDLFLMFFKIAFFMIFGSIIDMRIK
jgi:hypothetical protein